MDYMNELEPAPGEYEAWLEANCERLTDLEPVPTTPAEWRCKHAPAPRLYIKGEDDDMCRYFEAESGLEWHSTVDRRSGHLYFYSPKTMTGYRDDRFFELVAEGRFTCRTVAECRRDAHHLHAVLAGNGIHDQRGFASKALGKPIANFTDLTPKERNAIHYAMGFKP